jgi:hypothetical protein
MTDEEKALVLGKDSAITEQKAGSKAILNRIVTDAMSVARSPEQIPISARFPIGDYEFKEPDYRQIVRWAEQLDLSHEEVVERLGRSIYSFEEKEISFEVQDGSIVSLVIDYELFPIIHFICEKGLAIRELAFKARSEQVSKTIEIDLEFLNVLYCSDINLVKLELSNVPALYLLDCSYNKLTTLDLSNVPALNYFSFFNNQLTELDISNVPFVTELGCGYNRLTNLDLSNVPALTLLDFGFNQLTDLDLSNVPALTELYCYENQLNELDLTNVPLLTRLNCAENQLTKLDLSNLTLLTRLNCAENQLAELNLLNVPLLTELYCHDNMLTELDISAQKNLVEFTHDLWDDYYAGESG